MEMEAGDHFVPIPEPVGADPVLKMRLYPACVSPTHSQQCWLTGSPNLHLQSGEGQETPSVAECGSHFVKIFGNLLIFEFTGRV